MRSGSSPAEGQWATLRGYLAAVLLSVAFVLLRGAMEPLLFGQAPFLVLAAAPLLAAWYAGTGPGLLALALCSLAGQMLFAQGHEGGLPASSEGWLRLGSFLALGAMSVWL
ncbi:MAG TPA: hybrid sensor histidine kinase/response regulator, partial [Ramlibacter sp.]